MSIKLVAHQYARALFETAQTRGIMATISEDLTLIQQCIQEIPILLQRLSSPTLNRMSRQTIFEKAFIGKIHVITLNFLKVIANNNRQNVLQAIIDGYFSLTAANNAIVDTIIESANRLNCEQKNAISDKLNVRYNRTFNCTFRENPLLIGGFTVHFENIFIDNSISGKLKKLRHTMKNIS